MNNNKIFFLLLTVCCSLKMSAQTDTIRSVKLDSLIWKKVSEYRKKVGQRPLKEFQTGKLRTYTLGIVERNLSKEMQEHSHQAAEWYNAECLFRTTSNGNAENLKSLYKDVQASNFESLATACVNGWINSPSHNTAITRPEHVLSSVAAIIVCEQKEGGQFVIRMDVVYHTISDHPDDCSQCYANLTG